MRGAHRSASAAETEKRHRLVKRTSIKRLLLATDFSGRGSSAEDYACALAASWRAELTVMTVLEFPPGMDPEYAVNKQYSDRADVRRVVAAGGVQETGTAARHCGDNTNRHRDSKRRGHCRGCRGRVRFSHCRHPRQVRSRPCAVGATAERVIRTAPCPVLAVHTTKAEGRAEEGMCLDRILVPTDFSECSRRLQICRGGRRPG